MLDWLWIFLLAISAVSLAWTMVADVAETFRRTVRVPRAIRVCSLMAFAAGTGYIVVFLFTHLKSL
jgi:hypothetical protein